MLETEKMECSMCGRDGRCEEYLFNYNGDLYCSDCLETKLECEGNIRTSLTTSYFTNNGSFLGTDDDNWDLILNMCEEFGIEKIEM